MHTHGVLTDAPLVAFAPIADADRARAFYEGVLGLELLVDDAMALVFRAAGGAVLRLPVVERFTPQPFTVVGWRVDDLAAAQVALIARGVVFERFGGMEQDELGAWWHGGGGGVAWFRDPDGNLLSISGGASEP